MPIVVIDKIKQKNNGTFKLMDAIDIESASGKNVEDFLNDLDHDKLGIARYPIKGGQITQQDAIDILNNYSNYDGLEIEFLSNTDSPNKAIARGFVLMDTQGNKLLYELSSNGIITEWNSVTHRKINGSGGGGGDKASVDGTTLVFDQTIDSETISANNGKPTTANLKTLRIGNVNYKVVGSGGGGGGLIVKSDLDGNVRLEGTIIVKNDSNGNVVLS